MYLAGGALEKSQQVYIKNLNVEMSLAVLAKRQLSAEETLQVREELIEALTVANHNEQAADLLAEADQDNEQAFELYVRANTWQKAIKLAERSGQAEKIESVLKPALAIACDLKANQLR